MRVIESFLHFFTPRHTNNHKARALHFSSISTYVVILLVVQILISTVARIDPKVLGYASNINVSDLLKYTNEKRAAAGLSELVLDEQLSSAAKSKAADMFANNYWSHNSPAGRDPWSFIVGSNYHYLFAGENLARDFGDSRGVVEAWMNSSSHRGNIVNEHYRDIGFAVVNGKLNGKETTLVVQMFGTKPGSAPTVSAPQVALPQPTVQNNPAVVLGSAPQPKIDILSLTRTISFGLIAILMAVMVVDSILIYKRKIVRFSSHNLAHLFVLISVLVLINVIGRGIIL